MTSIARKALLVKASASIMHPTHIVMIMSQTWINKVVVPQDRHKDRGWNHGNINGRGPVE